MTIFETSRTLWFKIEGRTRRPLCLLQASTCRIRQESGLNGALVAATDKADGPKMSKNAIMRLARVERAAFGTGNRRASHCATTPLEVCLQSEGSSLSGRKGSRSTSWEAHQSKQPVRPVARGRRRRGQEAWSGDGCRISSGSFAPNVLMAIPLHHPNEISELTGNGRHVLVSLLHHDHSLPIGGCLQKHLL